MIVTLAKKTEDKVLLRETLEDLNLYLEHFIGSKNLDLLRSKLRFLHQNLTKSDLKSLVRGILTYLKRWPTKKIWLRVATIMQKYTTDNNITSLQKRKIIENNRFVGHGSVLKALNGRILTANNNNPGKKSKPAKNPLRIKNE